MSTETERSSWRTGCPWWLREESPADSDRAPDGAEAEEAAKRPRRPPYDKIKRGGDGVEK